jgi:hypothetical protein
MFIHLDESLASNEIIASNIHAFMNIAQAAREGKHIVSGDRSVMKLLATSSILDDFHRSIYYTINNNLQELNSIRKQLGIYVRVIKTKEQNLNTSQNIVEITLDISDFDNSSLIQRTILLGENPKDARIYKKIAESYTKENRLTIKISCTEMSGGGSTTASIFDGIQKQLDPRFCLCIVDSDKTRPSMDLANKKDGYGDTAKKLIEIRERNPIPRCDIHVIQVRDIENLFFFEIYDFFIKEIPDKKNELSFLKELVDSHSQHIYNRQHHYILWYADIKDGTKLVKIFANKGNSTYDFWISYADNLFVNSHLCRTLFINADCIQRKACSKNPSHCKEQYDSCGCFITPRLGKILDKVYAHFEVEQNKESTFVDLLSHSCLQDPILGSIWEEIGRKVMSWCCSVEPIRTSSTTQKTLKQ